MAFYPTINKKLLWFPMLLALFVTIISNIIILSDLFISKSKRMVSTPPSIQIPHITARQRSDDALPLRVPALQTQLLQTHSIRAAQGLNISTRKLADAQIPYKSNVNRQTSTSIFSHQTLPPHLRSGLLKPGTKEEALARKLMSVRRLKLVNSHDYEYRINPSNVCTNKEVQVALCVMTAVKHVKLRGQFRYGINGGYAGIWNEANKAVLLFFLGLPSGNHSANLQDKVDNESLVYGDIVQATYLDTYRNLSIKTVSILKWVTTHCSNAQFVIKTDDDCDVNIPLMITELRKKQQERPLFLLGKISRKLSPVRATNSKWYIPRSLYKEDKYPTFIYGGSQGFPIEVAKLLYEASLRIPFFWLEDVYISGLCANLLNIPRFDSIAFYFSHFPPPGETEY